MAEWWRSTIWVKIGAILMNIALLLNVLGFATPAWLFLSQGEIYVTEVYLGLWQSCSYSQREKRCSGTTTLLIQQQAWFVATQVFASLGLAFLAVSAVLFFLYVFVPKCHQNRGCLYYGILFGWIAGLFLIIAIAIFGVKQDERTASAHSGEATTLTWLFYSFYLELCSALLSAIAGLFGFREYRKRSYV